MVNPQRSGVRSEIRLCLCVLTVLEKSGLVIFRPNAGGTSDGEMLLESCRGCYGNFLGKRY